MKQLPTLIIFALIVCNVNGQNDFEGIIKFSTEISVSELAPDGFAEQLKNKYGDSLLIYYSANGNFRRVHLNSGKDGADSQYYFSDQAKLYFTYKNSSVVDSLDARENSLKLINKRKINNQKIIDLDCECFEYDAISTYDFQVILIYCFHFESPKINPEFYKDHNDFFLNDYYLQAKRPYLKFSIKTDDFTITYRATELIEKKLDDKIFEVEPLKRTVKY